MECKVVRYIGLYRPSCPTSTPGPARKAALERAQASAVLAQKAYDRVRQFAEQGNTPQARLDQATDALHEGERSADQAKSTYEQAVNGYAGEEHAIAQANVDSSQ